MIRLIVLALLLVCAMPSTADSKLLSLGEFYDTQARYRHHYHRHRPKHRTIVHESRSPSPPAKTMAPNNLGPFDWQKEIPFQGLDISAYLKPINEDVPFPQSSPPRKIPIMLADELNAIDALLPPIERSRLDILAYFSIFIGLFVCLFGMQTEFIKLRTCHKHRGLPMFSWQNAPRWVRMRLRRHWHALVSLRLPTIRV